jgi:acetyltransferase-like isoleucine patch superfamily enzyme
VRIGANVDVAPYVKFQCGSHELGRRTRRAGKGRSLSITIGEGCWLGSSSTILAGAEIGAGSVVAAGSVVIAGKYPENALLAGVPAKPVKVYSN